MADVYTIAASADDAYEFDGSLLVYSASLQFPPVGIGSSYIGLRFASVTKPAGGTLISAKLVVKSNIFGGAVYFVSSVYGEDSAASVDFATSPITTRVLLGGPVAWNDAESESEWVDSPDLTTLVNAMMAVSGWASGSPLTFVWIGNASDVEGYYDPDASFVAHDFYGTSSAPRLELEWAVEKFATSEIESSLESDLAIGESASVVSRVASELSSESVAIGIANSETAISAEAKPEIALLGEIPGNLAISTSSISSAVAIGDAESSSDCELRTIQESAGIADGTIQGESRLLAGLRAFTAAAGDAIADHYTNSEMPALAIADGSAISHQFARGQQRNKLYGEVLAVWKPMVAVKYNSIGGGDGAARGESPLRAAWDSYAEADAAVRKNILARFGIPSAVLSADFSFLSRPAATLEVPAIATPDGTIKGNAELKLAETITGDAVSAAQAVCISRVSSQFAALATALSSLPAQADVTIAATLSADWFAFGFVDTDSTARAITTPDGTIQSYVDSFAIDGANATGDNATQAAAVGRTEIAATTLADGSPAATIPADGVQGVTLSVDSRFSTIDVIGTVFVAEVSPDGTLQNVAAGFGNVDASGLADSLTQSVAISRADVTSSVQSDGGPAAMLPTDGAQSSALSADWSFSTSHDGRSKFSVEATTSGDVSTIPEILTSTVVSALAESATQAVAIARMEVEASTLANGSPASLIPADGAQAVTLSADWNFSTSQTGSSSLLSEATTTGTIETMPEARVFATTSALAESSTQAMAIARSALDTTSRADGFPMARVTGDGVQIAVLSVDSRSSTFQASNSDLDAELSTDVMINLLPDSLGRVNLTGDAVSSTQAVSISHAQSQFAASGTASPTLPTLAGVDLAAEGAADWSIAAIFDYDVPMAVKIGVDGSISFMPSAGVLIFPYPVAESHTLAEMPGEIRQLSSAEASGTVKIPANSRAHVASTLFTDVFAAAFLPNVAETRQILTPDGSISLPTSFSSSFNPSFHAFQAIATAFTTNAVLEVATSGEGFAAASPLSSGTLLTSPYGERFVSSLSIVSSTVDVTSYGYAPAGHRIELEAKQSAVIEAQGRANAITTATTGQSLRLDGLLQAAFRIDSLGGLRVYVEPPRVTGDLVSEFGTFYVGGGVGVASDGRSKGVVYAGGGVGVASSEN